MDLATILGKHNQNWQVLVFLTVLCIVLGFVAKLCRESRCFGVKFYVANHAVLVPHFDPPKRRSCHKTGLPETFPGNIGSFPGPFFMEILIF